MKVVFDNWQLRALNNHKVHNLNGMLEATVPGCVHTDLLAHDLIPDPYLDLNENDLKWIGETDWEYSTTFDLSAELLSHEKLELVCEGLDTLATLFVNDKEIAKTFNMHRAYTFDLKAFVTEGANQLRIVFTAPLIWTADKEKELGALPNASIGLPFNFIRKMACNFGWDWGPKVTTSGIWQPIYIRAWNIAKLTSVRPLISLSDDLSEAELNVHAGVESALEESLAELHICLTSPQGKCLYEGRDTKLKLDQPELWWPVGRPVEKTHCFS